MIRNKQKIINLLSFTIFACLFVLMHTPVKAEDLFCLEPSSRSARCSFTCTLEGGVPCENETYCNNTCDAIEGIGESECCCFSGKNKAEIPIGRLTDETEYLADRIIEEAEIIIEQAEIEINAAKKLGDDIHVQYPENPDEPGCRKQNCTAECDNRAACIGCECGGCEEGETFVEQEACAVDTDDCEEKNIACCKPGGWECEDYGGNQTVCIENNCYYWDDETCHEEEPTSPTECSGYSTDDCPAECYAYDGGCHEYPKPPPPAPGTTFSMPVLVLRYYPLQNNHLDPNITGMSTDLDEIRSKVNKLTNGLVYALEEASKYHGYEDSSAVSSLDYSIVEKKEFLEAMPVSSIEVFWNPGAFRPNYFEILRDVNICHYVENLGVKEVWLWGYHHGNIEPAESNMSGPYGDISNSEMYEFDMPICDSTYVLYNYNYGIGMSLGHALEDHTHQIEAVMNYLNQDLWNRFKKPYGEDGQINQCGWTHCPPNVRNCMPDHQYEWENLAYLKSNCEDWHPDGSGQTKQVNADAWAQYTWGGPPCEGSIFNGDPQNDHSVYGTLFKIWWMQNIPGKGNDLYYNGKKLKNWWEAIGDFDGLMQRGEGLTAYNELSNKTYGALENKKIVYNPDCPAPGEPGTPTQLTADPDVISVFLDWELENDGCQLCNRQAGQCFWKPHYQIEYWRPASPRIHISEEVWGSSEITITLPYLPGAGENHDWQWRVKVDNGRHENYSSTESFTINLSTPTPNKPILLNIKEDDIACAVEAKWIPGNFNHSNDKGCTESLFELQYKKQAVETWQSIQTNITETIVILSNTGEYDWRVRQSNGCSWSEWAEAAFDFKNSPKWPEQGAITDIWIDYASFKWMPGASRCGDCNCGECEDITYRLILHDRFNHDFLFSDWLTPDELGFDGTWLYYTKEGLESGITYDVWIQAKNGCDVESGWDGLGSFTTICDCLCRKECALGDIRPEDTSCSPYKGGVCVDQGSCVFVPFNGTPGTNMDCYNQCKDGQECCLNLTTACLPDESACTYSGGFVCSGYTCNDESACFGRCSEIESVCCTSIDTGSEATASCSDIACDAEQGQSCCCSSAYNYCEPGECHGEPCPYADIDAQFKAIESALISIREAKERMELIYNKIEEDVPPKLKVVREKIAECFMEAGAEEAVARGEQGIVYLTDCQNALEAGDMYSFMPFGKEGRGYEGLEGLLEILGKNKTNIERGCYGNTYRKNFEGRIVSGEMTQQRVMDLAPPYPAPWAEDLFCCFWK